MKASKKRQKARVWNQKPGVDKIWIEPDHGSDHGLDHGPDHRLDHGPDHGSDQRSDQGKKFKIQNFVEQITLE